jgi:hypothetical protein
VIVAQHAAGRGRNGARSDVGRDLILRLARLSWVFRIAGKFAAPNTGCIELDQRRSSSKAERVLIPKCPHAWTPTPGVGAAHLMFELPLWQLSITVRTGPGQWLAEAVATFGLLLTIFGCVARPPAAVPYAVGLYITAAYWFTASTSFANPAVTIARALSDTFAGIAPAGVAAFIVAQIVGMFAAVAVGRWLWKM